MQESCGRGPKAVRMAIAVQSQILREWGRFDEAIEMLRRHDEETKFVIPAFERRIRAVCALDMSRIEAECGRADDAWTHIQEARSELASDAKLGLKCDAAASWVLAARGLAGDSRRTRRSGGGPSCRFRARSEHVPGRPVRPGHGGLTAWAITRRARIAGTAISS